MSAGEATYRNNCALCHDSGAGQAPRITEQRDWTARLPRGRAAMYQAALTGVPSSAMTTRGGNPALTDSEVRAAVDFMLARVGLPVPDRVAIQAKPAPSRAPIPSVDDRTLTASVAEALRRALRPNREVDTSNGTLIGGIRVEARAGEVTLRGIVNDTDEARLAEAAASAVEGVTRIVNNLASAGIFEWD